MTKKPIHTNLKITPEIEKQWNASMGPAVTDRKFRTIHLKPGERVSVSISWDDVMIDAARNDLDLQSIFLDVVEIESLGKSSGRGNRHTVRVEAPPGSSIEIVK